MNDKKKIEDSTVNKIGSLFGFTSIDDEKIESNSVQGFSCEHELKYIQEKYGNGKNQRAFECFTREILRKIEIRDKGNMAD